MKILFPNQVLLCLFASVAFLLPLSADQEEDRPKTEPGVREELKKTEPKAEAGSEGGHDKHREMLEAVHRAEMKRLEEMKRIGKERERDDMVKEAEDMIKQAEERHAFVLKQLDPESSSGKNQPKD